MSSKNHKLWNSHSELKRIHAQEDSDRDQRWERKAKLIRRLRKAMAQSSKDTSQAGEQSEP
jgi:hypothetical protein